MRMRMRIRTKRRRGTSMNPHNLVVTTAAVSRASITVRMPRGEAHLVRRLQCRLRLCPSRSMLRVGFAFRVRRRLGRCHSSAGASPSQARPRSECRPWSPRARAPCRHPSPSGSSPAGPGTGTASATSCSRSDSSQSTTKEPATSRSRSSSTGGSSPYWQEKES